MKVGDYYSHKGGQEFISTNRQIELQEIVAAIEAIDAVACMGKISKEKRKPALLFSPIAINKLMSNFLYPLGWGKKKYKKKEMDGAKNLVGLEDQFGKYPYMYYDILAKFPIFAKMGLIDCGIEVVVMPSMLPNMSSGVSSFAQIMMDLQDRGVADIDIPSLVIGIECTEEEIFQCKAKQERFLTQRTEMILNGDVFEGQIGATPGPKPKKKHKPAANQTEFNFFEELL